MKQKHPFFIGKHNVNPVIQEANNPTVQVTFLSTQEIDELCAYQAAISCMLPCEMILVHVLDICKLRVSFGNQNNEVERML